MESYDMRENPEWLKRIAEAGLILMIGISVSANAGLFGFGDDSWKEEALQYDGSKIIVKRSQSYGGRHEIGQGAPIRDYNISFTPPNSAKTITWVSEYSEDVGRANLHPLALHVLNGTPYIITEPNLCLAYNKWGRPNPPYVIFKYDGKEWQRITIQELPLEFKGMNLVNNTKSHAEQLMNSPVVSVEAVKSFNSSLTQPEYKSILREGIDSTKVTGSSVNCEPMVHYKCGWFGTNLDGTFNKEFADHMCNK
jgi:hypothetical protein